MSDAVVSLAGTADIDQMVEGMRRIQQEAQSMGMTVNQYMASITQKSGEAKAAVNNFTESSSMSFRTINRAAGEGSRGVSQAMMTMQSGALDSAGAMDIFRIAMGAAFHGPETLLIVAAAAAIGAVVMALKNANEEARDVKWFGDEQEVDARYSVMMDHITSLQEMQASGHRTRSAGLEEEIEKESKQFGITSGLRAIYEDLDKAKHDMAQNEIVDKKAIAEAAKLAEDQAGDDPIQKMRAKHTFEMTEKDREQKDILLKIRANADEQKILQDQLAGDKFKGSLNKADQEEKNKYDKSLKELKSANDKLLMEQTATDQELSGLQQRFGLELQNEQDKAAAERLKKKEEADKKILAQANKFMDDMNKDYEKGIKIQEEQDKKQNEFYLKYVLAPKEAAEKKAEEDHKKLAAEELKINEHTLTAQKSFGKAMESLILELAGNSKEGFLIKQAFAAADIAIDTAKGYMGAVAAYPQTAGQPVAGWILATGIAEEAAVLAQTVKGFAAGTSWAPPGLAWVGEHGPELVNFRGGEQVHSAGESAGMGGGVNITVHYSPTVHGDMTPEAEKRVITGFKAHLRDTAREIEQVTARNYRP